MKRAILRKVIWRGFVFMFMTLALLLGAGVVYQTSASLKDRETYTAQGTIFEVNGRAMHLYCIGQGSPTVILESGVGGNTLLWAYIQPTIAETTRICSYDRAGYGWSEISTSVRTGEQLVNELHNLLEVGQIEPPYVLVGHSFGGIVIRSFASTYPDDVAGLVLLDSAHPNQFSVDNCVPACFPSSAIDLVDGFYNTLPVLAQIGAVRLLVPQGKLPLPFFTVPPDFPNREVLLGLFSTNPHSMTILAEWNAFPQSVDFVREVDNPVRLPVRMVTALNTYYEQPLPGEDPAETTNTWLTLQNDLMDISIHSEQTIVEDANHFSLLVNPNHAEIVSDTIIGLLESLSR